MFCRHVATESSPAFSMVFNKGSSLIFWTTEAPEDFAAGLRSEEHFSQIQFTIPLVLEGALGTQVEYPKEAGSLNQSELLISTPDPLNVGSVESINYFRQLNDDGTRLDH